MYVPTLTSRPIFDSLLPQVGECSDLAILDLRGNALTSLPLELARCSSLEFLHIGNNKVAEFGVDLCQALVNLRELYLYRNKISVMPPEV